MKIIPGNCQSEINRSIGSKPVNILSMRFPVEGWEELDDNADIFEGGDVYWFGDADTATPDESDGRILKLSDFTSTVKVNSLNSTSSVSVTLDDSDLMFFKMMETRQFQGAKVEVYQTFKDFTGKFLLMSGRVSGRVKWNTAEREFSFDVTDQVDPFEAEGKLLFGEATVAAQCVSREPVGTFKPYDPDDEYDGVGEKKLIFVQHRDEIRDGFSLGGTSKRFLLRNRNGYYEKISGGLFELPGTDKQQVKLRLNERNLPYFDEPIALRPHTKEFKLAMKDGYLREVEYNGVTDFIMEFAGSDNIIVGGYICVSMSKLFFPRRNELKNIYVSRRIMKHKGRRVVIDKPFCYLDQFIKGWEYLKLPVEVGFKREVFAPSKRFTYRLAVRAFDKRDEYVNYGYDTARILITEFPVGFEIESYEATVYIASVGTELPIEDTYYSGALYRNGNQFMIKNMQVQYNDEIYIYITALRIAGHADGVSASCRVESAGYQDWSEENKDDEWRWQRRFPTVGDGTENRIGNWDGEAFLWYWRETDRIMDYQDVENYIDKCVIYGYPPMSYDNLIREAKTKYEDDWKNNAINKHDIINTYIEEQMLPKGRTPARKTGFWKDEDETDWVEILDEVGEGDEIYGWQDYSALYTTVQSPAQMFPPLSSFTPNDSPSFPRVVPSEFWEENTDLITGGPIIRLQKDLSGVYMPTGKFSDSLTVQVKSTLPSNPARVVEYLIEQYTSFDIDQASLDAVAGRLENLPISFFLKNETDILSTIEKIASQFALGIYRRGNTVFVIDLTIEPQISDSIYTVDDNVIIEGTDSFESSYRENIINRYNVKYGAGEFSIESDTSKRLFGLKESSLDLSMHQNYSSAYRIAQYRLNENSVPSATFKCKLPLSALIVEPTDVVLLDTQGIHKAARVTKVIYDSASWLVHFECVFNIGTQNPWDNLPEATLPDTARAFPTHEWWYYDTYKEKQGKKFFNARAIVKEIDPSIGLTRVGLIDSGENNKEREAWVRYTADEAVSVGQEVVVATEEGANQNEVVGTVVSEGKKRTVQGTVGAVKYYDGPYRAVRVDDDTIRVLGYNEDSSRYLKNYVIIGTSIEEIAEEDIAISGNEGHVVLQVDYDPDTDQYTYSYSVSHGNTLATLDASIIFPIAKFQKIDGILSSIIQLQHGNIHYPARWTK